MGNTTSDKSMANSEEGNPKIVFNKTEEKNTNMVISIVATAKESAINSLLDLYNFGFGIYKSPLLPCSSLPS